MLYASLVTANAWRVGGRDRSLRIGMIMIKGVVSRMNMADITRSKMFNCAMSCRFSLDESARDDMCA